MVSALRRHFGSAGLVVSVIALVAALAGGALAASGGSNGGKATASAKSKKGPRGPKGATGATGAQGPAGANGKDGGAGSPGSPGANGVSVTSTEFGPTEEPIAEPCEERGGSEFKSASVEPTFACNGEEGSPWTAGGVLPSKATETGTWVATEAQYTAISFPIPLAASIAEAKVKLIGSAVTPPAECDNGAGEAPSAVNPEADPGYACVFVGQGETPVTAIFSGGIGVGKAGGALAWGSKQALTLGTFAVTAP